MDTFWPQPSAFTSRRWLAVIASVALVASTLVVAGRPSAASARHSPDHELAHAVHNPPGNNAVTYPLAENVKHVGGSNTSTGGHVVVEGRRLYAGAYGLGMRFFDISDPEKPTFIGHYTPAVQETDTQADAIRADAVPDAAVFDGRHIAVLNGTRRTSSTDLQTDRTEFVDVTNPASPKLLWEFVGPADGEAHNGDIVDERRLWLASGGLGDNGLRIYDLKTLLDGEAPQNLFRGNPVPLWESSPYRAGRPVGAAFTHTHDISVYVDHPVAQPDGTIAPRDIALLAEGGTYTNNAGDTGSLFVIDITDPSSPVVLNRWLHERGGIHHPIRYHHEAQFLDGDPSVVLVTDEDLHNGCGDAGGATALRVSPDLTRAVELSEWFIPGDTPAPVCSVHVFSSQGDLVFFGAYNAGLQVVDYSDPSNPVQAGYYMAPGTTAWGAQYHDGYIYVGDTSRGLDVFELDDPNLLPKLKLNKLLK